MQTGAAGGVFAMTEPCDQCRGRGLVVDHPCDTCRGSGRAPSSRTLNVKVPAGVKDGQRIRLAGKGAPGRRGGPAGDLFVVVHVTEHELFGRKGDDLTLTVPITFAEAALGTTLLVPTVEGEEEVEIKPGTQPGTEIRLRGKGVPHVRRSGVRGDLHVLVDVAVPTRLSKRQRELLTQYADDAGEAVGGGGGFIDKVLGKKSRS